MLKLKENNKVLLVRPENIYNYNNYPPLGLICIGAKLKELGFDPTIVNSFLEKDICGMIESYLHQNPALFIGISLLTSEVPDARRIIKFVKEHFDIPVVVGGWHCTLFPEQMAQYQFVDYCVAGEGEEHIADIARQLQIGHRPARKIFSKKVNDIESLPFPDYSLDGNIEAFIRNSLTDKLSEYKRAPLRWLPYESSRGCPSQCTFCINVVADNMRYRKKSAKKTISEIESIVGKFRLTHLKIIDDNFFVDIDRVREICEGILKRRLNITWDAECRCDYFNERMLNDETLRLLKKSGLIQLTLGVESGSLHSLQLMKKEITPAQAEYAIKQCEKYEIIARSSFIIEIPGERISDIKQTISFVNHLRRYRHFTCGVTTFRPYPKCELTTELVRSGHLKEPTSFDEWADTKLLDVYTSAEYVGPWQANGRYSAAAASYLNTESQSRLGNHQLDNPIERLKNFVFVFIAKARNRLAFYLFTFDKELYKNFLKGFYNRHKNSNRT